MNTTTYTTTMKHHRVGQDSSWRPGSDNQYAAQGWYTSDTTTNSDGTLQNKYERIGYIKLDNFSLSNVSISKIVFSGKANGGLGKSFTKTLRFCRYVASSSPSACVGSELGTVSTTNLGSNASFTITCDTSNNASLFNDLKTYFESGNSALILRKPNDSNSQSKTYWDSGKAYSDNYLTITELSIQITYNEKYTVSYNANGGTGAPAAQTKTHGTALTLSSTKPTYTGRTFQGWGTTSTDTSVDYQPGANYTTDSDITLYAIWKLNTYQVQYNANGYSVSFGLPDPQTKTHGTALTLSASDPSINDEIITGYEVVFDATGGNCSTTSLTSTQTVKSTFSHWNTRADNSGITYNRGGSYTNDANETLYLQVNSTNINGSITLPTATRSGYNFLGWARDSEETIGITGSYTPEENQTLYAMWEAQGLVHIDVESGWKAHTVWIDTETAQGSVWKQYIPCIDTGTDWKICGE